MDVVCFGQQNWDVCWTGKQQLMTRLARRGHRVLYVDPLPVDATPFNNLRRFAPGLSIYTEHRRRALPDALAARLAYRSLGRVVRRQHMTAPIALVLNPFKRWLKDATEPAARVYYAVDEWTGYGGTSDEYRRQARAAEDALLRESDVALAISRTLHDRLLTIQPATHLLESAADVDHFSPDRLARSTPHQLLAGLSRPRIGFIGQVDDRIDQELVVHLATARPDWQIILAGRVKEGVDVSRLIGPPNVRLLGYVPYADLPGVAREFDVCVVPYRLTELTHACSPLKVYEYLATGLPVVSTPLAGLGPCGDVIRRAESPAEFEAAVAAALADPAAGRAERLRVAAQNTWDERVDRLEDYLEEALRRSADRSRSTRRRRFIPGREADRIELRLDAKDGSERQLRDDFADYRISAPQHAFFLFTRFAGHVYHALRCAGRLARGKRPFEIEKILVVRRALLGDLVTFLPTLAALRRTHPNAKIVLGGQPSMAAAELLAGSADVDEVRVLDFMSHASRRRRLQGAWSLFYEGFDVLVCGVSYFLIREAYYCGAPRIVGLYDGHPLQRLSTGLIPLDPARHEAENNLALAEALGCEAHGQDRSPKIAIEPLALARAAAALESRLRVPAAARVMTIHPGSKRPSRRWPAERFAKLAAQALAAFPDLHVVLSGVPDEQPLVDSIVAAVPETLRSRLQGLVGATDLAGLVALLDRSAAVVCNDTGVMHVARARGRPLLALLGPENDRRWGPHPLGAAPVVALRHEVPCAPCVRWTCEPHYCMQGLSVDEAIEGLFRLLSGATPLPIVGLERRLSRHDWRELASRFTLPDVTVFAAHARTSVAGCDYPHAEFVAPGAAPGALATWWTDDSPIPAGRLGADVAAFVRSADTAAVDAERVYNERAVLDWPCLRGGVTYRRDVFEQLRTKTDGVPSLSDAAATLPERS